MLHLIWAIMFCFFALVFIDVSNEKQYTAFKHDFAVEVSKYIKNPHNPVAFGSDKLKIRMEVVNKDRGYYKITVIEGK